MMSGSMKIVPSNGGASGVGGTEVVGTADGGKDVGEVDASGVGGTEVVGTADGGKDVGEVDVGDPPPLHAELANAATKTEATILIID